MKRKIERRYRVVLRPVGGPDDGGAYEPRIVRLAYWPDQIADGPKKDPRSEAALAEAAKRAVRLERREFLTPPDREFDVHVEYLSAGLVPPRRRRSAEVGS